LTVSAPSARAAVVGVGHVDYQGVGNAERTTGGHLHSGVPLAIPFEKEDVNATVGDTSHHGKETLAAAAFANPERAVLPRHLRIHCYKGVE